MLLKNIVLRIAIFAIRSGSRSLINLPFY